MDRSIKITYTYRYWCLIKQYSGEIMIQKTRLKHICLTANYLQCLSDFLRVKAIYHIIYFYLMPSQQQRIYLWQNYFTNKYTIKKHKQMKT